MDIKEIALKVGLQVLEEHPYDEGHVVSPSGYTWIDDKLIEFAEALISAYKAELMKEVGEPVLYAEFAEDGGWLGDASEYEDHIEEPHALFTSDQVAAAIIKATKPLEKEVERLKGIKNVQLDIYPNDAGTKQQREVDGALEMGQLLADSKNEETSNPKAERAKSLVWMHTGGGHIADSSGKHIGIFSGDFKHRDRLICAVNSESELLAKLAKAEQLWQIAQGRCDALEEKLVKAEQRVAEWQPIETAPKDGQSYLAYSTEFVNQYWVTDKCNGMTHWMPLPKAPANGGNS